jgi:hypothetical protein
MIFVTVNRAHKLDLLFNTVSSSLYTYQAPVFPAEEILQEFFSAIFSHWKTDVNSLL